MQDDRKPASEPVGRLALVLSAAELFARSGYDGVSLREINRHAGLSAAAAHYHFRTKEALYAEVVSRGARFVKPKLLMRFGYLAESDEQPTADSLVAATGQTYRDYVEADAPFSTWWLQIMTHLSDAELASFDTDVAELMAKALARVYPDVAQSQTMRAWRISVSTLINQLAVMSHDDGKPRTSDLIFSFTSGGLEAAMHRLASIANGPIATANLEAS